jgi:hypothetical protein
LRREKEAEAIRSVCKQAKAIARQWAAKARFWKELCWGSSGRILEIARQLDAIDLNGCPQDFQAAFKKNIAALEELGRVMSNNEGLPGFTKNLLTFGQAYPAAMKDLDEAEKAVDSTDSDIQQCAIRHGVAP